MKNKLFLEKNYSVTKIISCSFIVDHFQYILQNFLTYRSRSVSEDLSLPFIDPIMMDCG